MRKLRLPLAKDVVFIQAALRRFIPIDPDTEMVSGWRTSIKGVPNFRVSGITEETSWLVDIYAGQYHIVTVGNYFPEKCKTVPAIVNYLKRTLGVM